MKITLAIIVSALFIHFNTAIISIILGITHHEAIIPTLTGFLSYFMAKNFLEEIEK